ncbi:MAG: hydantoinase/oxoprolinase family protein [Nitrososphaerota archaeon]
MIRVAVDVGGTFTDLVAVDEESGRLYTVKVRSTPKSPEIGFLDAVGTFLQTHGVSPSSVRGVVHVGTIGTNLFLGQLGLQMTKVALVTTNGFRDVIEIGRQNRPRLYDVFFQRPPPIVPRHMRFEVAERIEADGTVILSPSETELNELAEHIKHHSPDSVAVSLLNSYVNPANEKAVKKYVEEVAGVAVYASHEVDSEYREFERTSTTVVNAALAPVVSRYLEGAGEGLARMGVKSPINLMSSAGGLVDISEALTRPIITIESGPAAGVVGAATLAHVLSLKRVISLDMGGTTAKAGTVLEGRPLIAPEMVVGGEVHMGRVMGGSGYPVRTPTVDLAEVSAGGGTIIRVDSAGTIRVGPMSAGAYPGPACYGQGGNEATITDANLFLGRLGESLAGGVKLDFELARSTLKTVASAAGVEPLDAAWTAITLANLNMAKAVNIVSLERGLDPRDFTLMAFGGAGPMHAAELAENIGVESIIIPPYPGLFSAIGLLTSDLIYTYVRGYVGLVEEAAQHIEQLFLEMEELAAHSLRSRGLVLDDAKFERRMDMRYLGQGYELEVPAGKPFKAEDAATSFAAKHEAVYGYIHAGEKVETTALRLYVSIPIRKLDLRTLSQYNGKDEVLGYRDVWFGGDWVETPVAGRVYVGERGSVDGPLIIEEMDSTVVVPPRWTVKRVEASCLLMRRKR